LIREILKYPNPALKQKSLEVLEVTQEIKDLAQDLIDTMQASNGVGLSAPQIGVLKRVIVVLGIESSSMAPVPIVMVNPVIWHSSGSNEEIEGCLSFPGLLEKIRRPDTVEVLYRDLDGFEKTAIAEGIEARCILHEVDHLDGHLFIEKLSQVKKSLLKKKLRKVGLTK